MNGRQPRIAFTTLAAPGRTAVQIAGLANLHGYEGVELRLSNRGGDIQDSDSPLRISRIARIFQKADVRISGLLSYLTLELDDKEDQVRFDAELDRTLSIAQELDAPSVRLFGPTEMNRAGDGEKMRRMAEILDANLWRHTGVRIHLQNHGFHLNLDEAFRISQASDTGRVSIGFATDHFMNEMLSVPVRKGNDLRIDGQRILEQASSRVDRIYFSDFLQGKPKNRGMLPGCGIVPFDEWIPFLQRRMEPTGTWWVLKYEKTWDKELAEPEVSLPAFMQWIRRFDEAGGRHGVSGQ